MIHMYIYAILANSRCFQKAWKLRPVLQNSYSSVCFTQREMCHLRFEQKSVYATLMTVSYVSKMEKTKKYCSMQLQHLRENV